MNHTRTGEDNDDKENDSSYNKFYKWEITIGIITYKLEIWSSPHVWTTRHHCVSSHLPTKTESERETVRLTSHCWDWTLCRGPSVPWHVCASKLLYHWWFSSVYGSHEYELETYVTCFSLSDKEHTSQPSQLGCGVSLFWRQYWESNPNPKINLLIKNQNNFHSWRKFIKASQFMFLLFDNIGNISKEEPIGLASRQ